MRNARTVRLGRRGSRRGLRHAVRLVAIAGLAVGATGCSLDGLLDSDELPPNVTDPTITQTPEGARRAYQGVVANFRTAFGGHGSVANATFVTATALLSDELQQHTVSDPLGFDVRNMTEGERNAAGFRSYVTLQKTRAQAGQAIRLLGEYLPDEPALAGRLYALQGYTELFLAELFCSGIPLSTLDYGGDYTYYPGSTTTQVLTHAVALFDTALTLAADSARFVDLARVGQGRALLGLGEYVAAAAAVADVSDSYRYSIQYNNVESGTTAARNFAWVPLGGWDFTVPDREGSTGMNWRTSGDPRTPTTAQLAGSITIYHPNKYATDGSSAVVLASGLEARLIQAETQLHTTPDDGAWLATLNTLRTDGTQDGGGEYNPGIGSVAGLAPLADPGPSDPNARIDLLFRERAFWLFLTGHRQGDLRRLIRQYHRSQGDIYPVGPYPSAPYPYGADINVPIPSEEFVNPLFTGCASRGA